MREVFPAVSVALNRTLLAGVIAVSPLFIGKAIDAVAPGVVEVSSAVAQVKAKNKHAGEQRKFQLITQQNVQVVGDFVSLDTFRSWPHHVDGLNHFFRCPVVK